VLTKGSTTMVCGAGPAAHVGRLIEAFRRSVAQLRDEGARILLGPGQFERLGHADPAITLRVYAHVINEQLVEAADIFARQISGAA
jgi:integrase